MNKKIYIFIVILIVCVLGYISFHPAKQKITVFLPVSQTSIIQTDIIVSSTTDVIVEATYTPTPIAVATSTPKPIVKAVVPTVNLLTPQDVLNEWGSYVVRVYCIKLDNNGNKQSYSDGSGLLVKNEQKGLGILTNTHVFIPDGEVTDYCDVTFPENSETYRVEKSMRFVNKNQSERGYLVLPNPSQYVSNLFNEMNNGKGEKSCTSVKAGDNIVLLGYPKNKPKDIVSYSSGKILSYESPYYVSSATGISGYSGGIAVSLQEDCNIGIPTYQKSGDITKSLILDAFKY